MNNPEDWFRHARNKYHAAAAIRDNRRLGKECHHLCGVSIEFALKGAIMKRHRLNQWPDRESRPDLYTHNLRTLFEALGIQQNGLSIDLRVNLRTVLNWSRSSEYVDEKLPRKEVVQFYDAAYGTNGVMQWLMTL